MDGYGEEPGAGAGGGGRAPGKIPVGNAAGYFQTRRLVGDAHYMRAILEHGHKTSHQTNLTRQMLTRHELTRQMLTRQMVTRQRLTRYYAHNPNGKRQLLTIFSYEIFT